ncbi:MAG TPA: hypothetical protein VHC69_08260 [Polyangiaceae bacterium]|nr:hypothetical protein [Polyangiaceae bacterium]
MKASRAPGESRLSDVIASRLLVEKGTRRKVEVVFHVPRRMLSSKREEWACLLEIRRGREAPEQLYGRGADSLESLVAALGAALRALRPELVSKRIEREKARGKKRRPPSSA